MADKKPLVVGPDPYDAGSSGGVVVQQLQKSDELDIPLADRVERLSRMLALTIQTLVGHGLEVPGELVEFMMEGTL